MSSEQYKKRADKLTIPMVSTIPETVTAESVTVPAGAAGVIVNFFLARKPIFDSHNCYVGGFGDTSVVLTSTAFDTEVSSETKDADLTQGDYWVDYVTGKCRGMKADGSVSLTATYAVPSYNVTLETGDLEIGAVELKDGATDARATINAANTARTTGTVVVATQQVDATGKVSPAGEAVGNAPFVKLTDGVDTAEIISTINSVKTDNSSVAGTATAVNAGTASAGTQRIALARDARGNSVSPDLESPHDFSVAYTSTTTTTCSGAPITIDDANCTVLYIQIKPTGGTWGARYVNGQDGVSIIAASNVLTIAGAGTPFASGDTYRVGLSAQSKGYVVATNAHNTTEVSPLSLQVLEESLLDTTNVAAATNYYPSSLGMAMLGYGDLSLSGKFIDADGTMTLDVEVTDDEDTTNADWISCGLSFTDVKTGINVIAGALTVTNGTLTFGLKHSNLNFRYARVVMTNNGATNTAIIKLRRKAL